MDWNIPRESGYDSAFSIPHEPVPARRSMPSDPEPDQQLYDQLSLYTLAHENASFIHQHIVDAYGAQHAGEQPKPIRIIFGLIGLYLYLEKGFTGRQVQRMHMLLANQRKQWPRLTPPEVNVTFTVSDVLNAAPGEQRDNAIREWCAAVWEIWKPQHQLIRSLAQEELDIQSSPSQ
jgi:Family of unknown function (DUF5946)